MITPNKNVDQSGQNRKKLLSSIYIETIVKLKIPCSQGSYSRMEGELKISVKTFPSDRRAYLFSYILQMTVDSTSAVLLQTSSKNIYYALFFRCVRFQTVKF